MIYSQLALLVTALAEFVRSIAELLVALRGSP